MTIAQIIQKAWRNVFSDTDYPSSGSSEMLKCVDFFNDALGEWEGLATKDAPPTELITREDVVFGGTGADDLPSDFFTFVPSMTDKGYFPAVFVSGAGHVYQEVNPREGLRIKQRANAGEYVFWSEVGKIFTYPILSETLELPYIRKAARVVTGDEATVSDCPDDMFLVSYISSYLANDDENDTKYELFGVKAVERLDQMEYRYCGRLVGERADI